MLHALEGLSEWSDVERFYLRKVLVLQFLEDHLDIRSVFDRSGVVCAEDSHGFLEADAVLVHKSPILEMVDNLLFSCLILEIEHDELHVDFQEIDQNLESLDELLLINQLVRLLNVHL